MFGFNETRNSPLCPRHSFSVPVTCELELMTMTTTSQVYQLTLQLTVEMDEDVKPSSASLMTTWQGNE